MILGCCFGDDVEGKFRGVGIGKETTTASDLGYGTGGLLRVGYLKRDAKEPPSSWKER